MQPGRIIRTAARIARTRYPAFIAGLPVSRDEIPVFTYHDVGQTQLTGDLEFLRSNGYRTLSLDEFLTSKARGMRVGRSVLLTFDDARKSFCTTALPLLRAYDAKAVLFAPTYWMGAPRHEGENLFLSWDQLRECAASGFVDVQSHAHRHALVAIAAKVADFATPATLAHFDIYDWPMRRAEGVDQLGLPPPGAPVYRAAPLLSAPHRYLENETLSHACCTFVEQKGGAEFFSQPDALSQLRRFHDQRAPHLPGCLMDADQFRSMVDSEFEQSRSAFQAHLGYAPTSIAYPWMLGSIASLQVARRHGLQTAFGVARDYGAERRRARLPIPVYGRIKCDWLRFLPGAHRSNVLVVLRRKIADLSTVQHLAH